MSQTTDTRSYVQEWTVTMDCGAVYGCSGTKDEKWLHQIPVVVLSKGDIRFMLTLLESPDRIREDAHAHVREVLRVNVDARDDRFFTRTEKAVLNAWLQ